MMNTITTLLALAVAAAGHAFVVPAGDVLASRQSIPDCSSITCTPSTGAAHIIITRASTEAAGTGVLHVVSDAVVAACPSSDVVANPYPAVLDPYLVSEAEGVADLTKLVTEYKTCCPTSRIVLMGYSQGAQVTADFLCGTSEAGFNATPPFAAAVADVVSAIVLMGDPSFVKDQSWDRGDAFNFSYFPRQDNAACEPVAPQMISYCDARDYFCDSGTSSDALAIHKGYVQKYGAEAASYVIGRIGGCLGA